MQVNSFRFFYVNFFVLGVLCREMVVVEGLVAPRAIFCCDGKGSRITSDSR